MGTRTAVTAVIICGVGPGITVDRDTVGTGVGGTCVSVGSGVDELRVVTIRLRVGWEPEHPTANAMRNSIATAKGNLRSALNQPLQNARIWIMTRTRRKAACANSN